MSYVPVVLARNINIVTEVMNKQGNLMIGKQLMIDSQLVSCLVATQFPQFRDLPVQPVELSGWDNRTFRLGKHMLVRMPSSESYTIQVEKEQKWLPRLASLLPLSIPLPVAMGEAGEGYPW